MQTRHAAQSEMRWQHYGFQPSASVVVCVQKRRARLRDILGALAAQQYHDFEILVVDGARRAHDTRDMVASVPAARYVAAPRGGVCQGRNTAVLAATGDVIAFIDIDYTPPEQWLASLVSALFRPDVGCCIGPILPQGMRTRAQWLLETQDGSNLHAERRVFRIENSDPDVLSLPLSARLCGAGANMAFRKSVLRRIGGFNEALAAGGDIEMLFRTMRRGYMVAYEPQAAVRLDYVQSADGLNRRMYDRGRGYLGCLLNIATTDPLYRETARLDIANWFRCRMRQRLWRRLLGRDCFPLGLTMCELSGGLVAVAHSWLQRAGGSGKRGPCSLPAASSKVQEPSAS